MASIAKRHGWPWKQLWEHADNAKLRELRKDPNILLPGDRVAIPERQTKQHEAATAAKHSYRRTGTPNEFWVRLLLNGRPIAGRPYTLHAGSRTIDGVTDADGWVVQIVPPDLAQVVLLVDGQRKDPYVFELGALDPLGERVGVQERLFNLGLLAGTPSGKKDDGATRMALQAFQRKHGLPASGVPDAATLDQLKAEYGC
jgi:hypothetical protein